MSDRRREAAIAHEIGRERASQSIDERGGQPGGRRLFAAVEEAGHGRQRHVTAIHEPRHRLAQDGRFHAREQQAHGLVAHQAGGGAKCQVERLVDEARHLRFIDDFEGRIDVGFERKFPKEAEAERVDGRNLDVADPLDEGPPPCGRDCPECGPPAQFREDALAHLRRRFPRERDGEDVARIDVDFDEPHVPIDEHAGLARAGRRLEHDVIQRIDSEVARRLVGRRRGGFRRRIVVAIKERRLNHRS